MKSSIRVTQIWGVEIGLHWSWFLIFILITSSLAASYFPDDYPALSPMACWILGGVTSLLFFTSVVLHELGHVRLALNNNVPVRSVTLFLFGGIAQLRREPASAGAELRIAIAGPLVSLTLAAAFGALWLGVQSVEWLAAPSSWLARINLILAVFNLIPGFPLDGGRILRALVWRWTGSQSRATTIATTIGQVVAIGFVAIGALLILSGDIGSGLWLIFIGWFLQGAAAATQARSVLDQSLQGVTTAQVMARSPAVIPDVMPLRQLVDEHILGSATRTFVVTSNGQMAGLITLKDVTRVPRDDWQDMPVGEAMVPLVKLATVTPETSLNAAIQVMDEADVAQVPVMTDGLVVGILTREEVLRYLRTRAELGI